MHRPQAQQTPSPAVVEIRTPARFHLGMFSFGDATTRAFGGTGLMLDSPGIVLRLRVAERFTAAGPHADRALAFARECAGAWGLPPHVACHLEVVSAPRAHVGLGSGTQLALAVAAGIRHLFVAAEGGGTASETRHFGFEEVVRCAAGVGRGRRSCVGMHGFAAGGLVVEAGRLAAGKTGVEIGAGRPSDGSPLIARTALPAGWRGVLVIDREAEGLHGEREKVAFQTLPPVDRLVTAELVRLAVIELLPAAVEGRFAEFSSAFHAYGRLAGVPFEPASRRLPFHDDIARLIDRFAELGIRGAAQSSWGPAVLGCCESAAEAERVVAGLDALGATRHHEVRIVGFDSTGASLRRTG